MIYCDHDLIVPPSEEGGREALQRKERRSLQMALEIESDRCHSPESFQEGMDGNTSCSFHALERSGKSSILRITETAAKFTPKHPDHRSDPPHSRQTKFIGERAVGRVRTTIQWSPKAVVKSSTDEGRG
jgi:hypothetical protein